MYSGSSIFLRPSTLETSVKNIVRFQLTNGEVFKFEQSVTGRCDCPFALFAVFICSDSMRY
jgi:hypothetical protein